MTTQSDPKRTQAAIFRHLDSGDLRVFYEGSRSSVEGLEETFPDLKLADSKQRLALEGLVVYLDSVKDKLREESLKLAQAAVRFDFNSIGINNFNRYKNLKASMLIISYCGAVKRNTKPVCSNSEASVLSEGRISIGTFNNSVVRLEKLGLVKNVSVRSNVFVKKRFHMLWPPSKEELSGLRAYCWHQDINTWLIEELENLLGRRNSKVLEDALKQRKRIQDYRDKVTDLPRAIR